MENSKVAAITNQLVPVKWAGDFDGKKLNEQVTYKDGTILNMEVILSEEPQQNLAEFFRPTLPAQLLVEIEEEEEEEENDLYVIVDGEDDCPIYCHRDVVDVYIECMADSNSSVTEEEVKDATSKWVKDVK